MRIFQKINDTIFTPMKDYLFIPAIILSSAIVEGGKKYFSNVASLQDMTHTEDPDNSTISSIAYSVTALATMMQLTFVGYAIWKQRRRQQTSPAAQVAAEAAAKNDTAFARLEEGSQRRPLPSDRPLSLTFEGNVEDEKKTASETVCKPRHCVGSGVAFFFKICGVLNNVTMIIAGKLALESFIVNNILRTTPEKFDKDDSNTAGFLRAATWIIPITAGFQYLIFYMWKCGFINANDVGNAIRTKNYNVNSKILMSSLPISVLCVVGNGLLNFLFIDAALPKIKWIKKMLDAKGVTGASFSLAAFNIVANSILVVPAAYRLLNDACSTEKMSALKEFIKQLTLLGAVNLTSFVFDATSNVVGIRTGVKCAMHEYHIGDLSDARHLNTTLVTSCPTQPWAEGIAYVIAIDGALAFFLLNLYTLNMQKKENTPQQTYQQLKAPGRNSVFVERAQPFLQDRQRSPTPIPLLQDAPSPRTPNGLRRSKSF